MERDRQYLLSLDPERLLHNFRVNAGLPSSATPLGGWEAPTCGLRGHFVGHYLSACAEMYRSAGDTTLRDRANYMVDELAKCQRADGYLSAFPSTDFDILETKYKGVWAPYYTIHKIMAGLFDVYQYCGNAKALTIDEKMAAYFRGRLAKLTPDQIANILHTIGSGPQNEFGGMSEVLHNIYAVDKDPAVLAEADTFDRPTLMDPLANGDDKLERLHANTHIPQVTGIARHYQLTGDPRYRTVAENFWNIVTRHHSFVTGANSFSEHFRAPDVEATALSPWTAETCNVYNMLKLTRDIFEWNPNAELADYYERALYNDILGSIDDDGMTTYFMPLDPGRFKLFSTPQASFWCCTGTGVENHAKYGDAIYFHNGDSLWVNLFIPSVLSWKDKGVTLKQETAFPATDHTTITLQTRKRTRFVLRLRVPSWAKDGVTVRINGKAQQTAAGPQSYLAIDRTWSDGDKVEYTTPMSLRVYHPVDAPSTVAIFYGPLVLAGELGTVGMPADVHTSNNGDFTKIPVPQVETLSAPDDNVSTWVKPVEGKPLTFTTVGVGKPTDVTLVPLYTITRERYEVYWPKAR
jgi:DUF1680 family protein